MQIILCLFKIQGFDNGYAEGVHDFLSLSAKQTNVMWLRGYS